MSQRVYTLPREVSVITGWKTEKSAEVIVGTGTRAVNRKAEVSRNTEVPNIKCDQRGIAYMKQTQLPVAKWYEVIGDSTFADAILDRMVHSAHRIELDGESMRKKKVK
jgi:DNA replication protein DnaC